MQSFVPNGFESAFSDRIERLGAGAPSEFPLLWGDVDQNDAGQYDWVPNILDRSKLGELGIVPLQRKEPWETIPLFADRFHPAQILGLFPAFSQLAIRFHRAIRALPYPIPVTNVAEERARVGVALIDPLRIEGVVTMQQGYKNFVEELGQHPAKDKIYYQILLHAGETPELSPGTRRVFHEIHAVPSVVALYQCEHCVSYNNTHRFHPSTRFAWEFDGENALMTDVHSDRFFRARIPQRLTAVDQSCPCGHPITLSL